ncbi:MAG: Maf family protein [Gammaproteobacteria bacterium]
MSLPHPDVVLASQSPRRRELLDQIGVRFVVCAAAIDESVLPGESPEVYVERMAREKAHAGGMAASRGTSGHGNRPVLGADTAVIAGGAILGKPRDRDDFMRMGRLLSGVEHRVLSAVALIGAGAERLRLSVSHVHMRAFDDDEWSAYWDSGEPTDKAGGYAIQGRGAVFIERLEGSFSGVMGLPLFETASMLRESGVDVL